MVEEFEAMGAPFTKRGTVSNEQLEILNVLAGEFLREYWGDNRKQSISLPKLLFDEQTVVVAEGSTEIYFDAEDQPFKAVVAFRGSGETT